MQPSRGGSSPSERIAASEVVLNEISASKQEPVSSTNFIQAARRAAQAAAAAPPAATGSKPNRVTALNDAARNAAKAAAIGDSGISSKIRALLVGASVVVIVLGTVKMGMNLLSGHDSSNSSLPAESSVTPPAPPPAPEDGPRSDASPAITPSMTSPTLLTRQSPMSGPQIISVPQMPAIPVAAPAEPVAVPAAAPVAPDVTGSIAKPVERVSVTIPSGAKATAKTKLTPVADKLPETIGSAALRNAANRGERAQPLKSACATQKAGALRLTMPRPRNGMSAPRRAASSRDIPSGHALREGSRSQKGHRDRTRLLRAGRREGQRQGHA